MPQESFPTPTVGAWSEPMNGLSVRLRVEFENLKPGLRHAVYLELKNHSSDSVAVTNQPRVRATILDMSMKPVSPSSFPMSGPLPSAQWAMMPRDAYLGFRIDMPTVGVLTREQGMVLIAVGGNSWGLKAGKYFLELAATFMSTEGGPLNQWTGEVELPRVAIVVTKGMLDSMNRD